MEMNFCRRCGTPLQALSAHSFKCENGHAIYLNPAPTVGLVLFNENDEAILAVRAHEPGKGLLDTIGGFLDGNESPEEAVIREVREELALEPSGYSKPELVYSASGAYQYGGETVPVVADFFTANLKPGVRLLPQDDVAGLYIRKLEDIELDKVAGVDVKKCIDYLVEKRKNAN